MIYSATQECLQALFDPQVWEGIDTGSDRAQKLDPMAQDVLDGLTRHPQKQLQPVYFYDEAGSLLYEAITELPEYYQTRAEAALLKHIAPLLLATVNPVEIDELGSGSSTKTRILLDACAGHGNLARYVPIDVSDTMLKETAETLEKEYPSLEIAGVCGTFDEAFMVLPKAEDRLYVFLGGTIGNFSQGYQDLFFHNLLESMSAGNTFLLGFDIRPHSQKPVEVIESAYNDAAGVTAQFNLNILNHLNTALGADFDPKLWRHFAIYNAEAHQIEMYLQSLQAQKVTIDKLNRVFGFEKNETILTEISRKFDPELLALYCKKLGFLVENVWTDEQRYFGLMLLKKPV